MPLEFHGYVKLLEEGQEIDITFDLDVNGILSVQAKERKTGSEQSIKLEGTLALESEEIEELLKTAEKYKRMSPEEYNPDDDQG